MKEKENLGIITFKDKELTKYGKPKISIFLRRRSVQ